MKLRYLALLPILALMGCVTSSSYMSPAQPPLAAAGNAVITFYRTSFVDGDIAQAPIVEKAGDSIKLVGIASSGTKIQYEVAPGEHSFVVGGQSSHYLKANVQAGKSYYVRVVTKMGIVKARFRLLAQKGGELPAAIEKASTIRTVKANASAAGWFAENKVSMQNKYNRAAAAYARKPHPSFTFEPGDGISISEDPNLKK